MMAALLAGGSLAAQTGRITGTVTSRDGGRALSGAVISVSGTAARAVTGPDGTYSVAGVPAGPRVVTAAVLGHAAATQSVTVGDGSAATANFQLAPSAIAVEGLVAIGYGTRQARDVTGSVETVSPDQFNTGRVVSTDQLIVGKVAGVQVTPSNEPGASSNIRIRGSGSVSATNEPLIVVDGVPLAPGGGLSAGRNPLNFINPQDIASVTVLKDAASAAIYGSRGANGVILVETKNGASRGPQFSYSSSMSTSSPIGTVDMLSADELRAAVQAHAPGRVGLLGTANTNWRDAIVRDAAGQEHQLAVNGNARSMNYRLSLGYLDQEGVLQGSDTKRYSMALTYNHQLFEDALGLRVNLRAARSDDHFTPGGVLGASNAFDPTQPIRTASGAFYEAPANLPLAPNNPVAELAYTIEEGSTFRSIANVEARYQLPFMTGLSVTARGAYDNATSERRGFWPTFLQNQIESPVSCSRGPGDPPCPTGTVNRSNPRETNTVFDAFANYAGFMDRLNSDIDATVGYSYEQANGHYPFLQAKGLGSNALGVSGIPDAVQQTTSLSDTERRLASFFGRVNLTFADKYLFSASVRRDGSSRFGPDHQWGTFPAVSAGWRISEEPFMAGMGWINDLKLRASWGANGNQNVRDYAWLATYQYSDAYARAQFGNEFVTTLRPTAADDNLEWERNTATNLGLDFGVMDSRLNGSLDYYIRDTDHLLFPVTTTAFAYVTNSVLTNVGSMRNEGVELTLNAALLQGEALGGLRWDANFNGAYNRNKLLEFEANPVEGSRIPTTGISGAVGNTIQALQRDVPVFSFVMLRHKSDANGDPVVSANALDMYEDINGDGVINESDRVVMGSPMPKWTLGHTSTFGFRNVDLGFTLRAQLGQMVYNNLASSLGSYDQLNAAGGIVNLHSSVLKYGFNSAQYFSDVYLEKGDFLRMDNLTLGYTMANFRGLQNLRVYGTVQNVLTITGYSGYDPEAGLLGIDNTIYPRSRTFTFGAAVGF